MKTKVLRLITIFLIFPLCFGCDLLKTESLEPGISIYKTKGDYFNLVDVRIKDNQVFSVDHFWNARYNTMNKMTVKGNDTIYQFRYKLPNGYILDGEADERYDAFLNITFKEQLYQEIENGTNFSLDSLANCIIDKDPYLEYYRFKKDIPALFIKDSLKIKQILLDGEIDKYFEKVK